ncbi:hypothetical protein T01_6935 [Trichinella spiralis]|uniref:Uncharacterized protein n=1 Tax=Trichinella spiralis TaxID=6334 RepID=A0A0V1AZR5_TRISP|nr:hypothetical protein T01_6935 [Trichinella spiralis]
MHIERSRHLFIYSPAIFNLRAFLYKSKITYERLLHIFAALISKESFNGLDHDFLKASNDM